MKKTDLIIVGAGPTGLSFAISALRYGLSFRIIDEKEGPSIYSKALVIQPRTLETFERIGCLEPFLKKGIKVTHLFYHCKKKKVRFSLSHLDTLYPFMLFLSQSETEKTLGSYLEDHGVKIEWKTRLLNIENQKALIQHESLKAEHVDADWIIGCDGAHSKTRRVLSLPFKGSQFSETFMIADVVADTPHTSIDSPHFYIHRKGPVLMAPLEKEGAFRLIITAVSNSENKELQEILKERKWPFKISEILWLSRFQIHRRIVSHFRKENVFLLGDAAHIHSPAGGQGMNTGIQDAENLSWKLALVIKGIGQPLLLDTYESERMPIAKAVLKWTTFVTKLEILVQKYAPFLFPLFFRLTLGHKKRQKKISNALTELSFSYNKSALVFHSVHDKEWKGPISGERAPDVHMENGLPLFRLFKTSFFHLLLFSENSLFIKSIQEKYGKFISIHVIKDKQVRKKYFAGPKTLYLIRPDGVIGYRSRSFKKEELQEYLQLIFKPF